jgi:nitroreductase
LLRTPQFLDEALNMFNDLSSPAAYLASRRSGKPREMVAPGPDQKQLDAILNIAMRTPDHGKLFPWRVVVINDRAKLVTVLKRAFIAANPDARPAQIDAATAPASMAPTLLILLHATQPSAKIPEWEQQLSTGAVAMNLLHAAHVGGFVGSWITGWAAYDPLVAQQFCQSGERIAGFFYLGTPSDPLEERPRPEPANIIRHWP